MDKNKLKVLQDLPYKIKRVCGNCEHAEIHAGTTFGVCGIHTYKHQKHTAEISQLSINVFGSCPSHEFVGTAPSWEEFVEPKRRPMTRAEKAARKEKG